MKTLKRKLKKYYLKIRFRSNWYWDKRYKTGGNSGTGSYNNIAEFKAKIVNDLLKKYEVKKVLDLGCGDGNQLSLLNIPSYIGFDVSKTAIEICKLKYRNDLSKKFFLYKKNNYQKYASEFKPDLILSLDVIYHLVEDNIFDEYIINLFNYALKYILIFSTDYDMINEAIHHRDRNFSNVILSKFPNWELVEKIYNPLKGELSSADFYFYQKIN